MTSTALARSARGNAVTTDDQQLRRAALIHITESPANVMKVHEQIADMIAKTLVDGTDYGKIPGTDKNALLKPGAERLAFSIGASIVLEIVEKEIDHFVQVPWTKVKKNWSGPKGRRTFTETEVSGTSFGIYRYVVKAMLVRREDGAVLGEGVGSCSTLEAKYIDRPRETENTVLKMAKKRASVDAVLTALAISDRFSPDDAVGDDADEDGAVKDPTDGLTLPIALAWKMNGVALGDMKPRALGAAKTYVDGKLQEDPESPTLLRLAAMVEMVRTHRTTTPLQAQPSAPASGDDFSDFASGDDDLNDPTGRAL